MVTRGDIWLAALDPSLGSETKKTRPCVVVSPPEIHDYLRTAIVAPMTTGNMPAPFRISIAFRGKRGLILLDQVRAIDKGRLVKKLGAASAATMTRTLFVMREMFEN